MAESRGEAELAKAKKQAEQTVVTADADLARAKRQAEQLVLTAEAHAKEKALAGKGEGQKALQIGLSEAAVVMKKVTAYGDPRLYAASILAERFANSVQPLVPQRMFVNGGTGGDSASPMALLFNLMLNEKLGLGSLTDSPEVAELKSETEKLTRETMATLAAK